MKKINFILLMLILIVTQNSFVRSATVVDVIVGSPDHETLESAVIAAGLDDDLSGPGPFTVFAPTDDAFAALPDGLLDALLADPTGALADVLLYHVAGDSVVSGDLSDSQLIETLFGTNVQVTIDGGVYINDAMVTVADLEADNGVVHVIDAVLVPTNTVVDVIETSEDHDTLAVAINAAELRSTLMGDGPFTVFAPTDDAFAALPEGLLDMLLADPTGALADVLLYHVAGDSVVSGDLSDGQLIETLLGNRVEVSINGGVFINDAQVTVADIEADNGVVHVIDAVLVPTNTVVDVIESSEDHTTLETAIELAELRDALLGEGPFTVFAPTDDAFAALPDGLLDALLADPTGALADVLLYHVAGDSVVSGDLSDSQLIETLFGTNVQVTIDGGVYINDAMVTVADLEADNGVVHVIDAVLVPTNTVVDVIETSEDHDTLAVAINAAELRSTLMGDGPFTVFAPTDDAFAALPEGLLDTLLADPTGDLAEILLYHVLNDSVVSGDLSDSMVVTTLLGKDILVTIDGGVYINDAMVTVADIEADNGVVHVIDAVLIPPVITVVDIIVNSPDHETLETAVIAAELADDLSGEGPFTVFAPTDDAFAALPEGVLDDLLADPTGALANVLLYHVVGDKAMYGDLEDGVLATLLGNKVKVKVFSGVGIYINDAQIIVSDIEADNGVVHVLDAVLVPSNTVVDIIETSEDHVTLATAIEAAELRDALMGEGPFTVFAPTDDAFAALPEGVLDDLLADPTGDLADILLYHVVSGSVMSGDLSDGQIVETLLGKDIEVTITGDGVFINDAQVIVADLEADNGVVHVIDAVLIPPVVTVVDIIVNSPDHETLETAVIAAELADDLSGEGPFTVFAPTDDAFAALPEGVLDALLADPTGALADVLLYHVASGSVMSGDLSDGQMITTLFGQDVEVTIDGGVYINDAMVTVADLEADNGVVHVIDAVLIPTVTALGSNVDESIQFSMYPNPASDYIYLNIKNAEFVQASVINASGAVVDSFNVSDTETRIDISNYAQGIYHIVISSENNVQTEKFIVR